MAKYAVILASLLALTACHGKGLPTAPTSNTSQTLAVSAGAMLGSDQQLTALLVAGDGSSIDVTTSATWRSANPSIATVSNTGLVHVVAFGSTEIQVTYLELTSTLQVGSDRVRLTISGRVTAAFPAQPNFVAGAKVEIITGSNAGVFAISDPDGFYSMPGLQPGSVGMRVSMQGYDGWNQDFQLDGDITVNPVLNKLGAAGAWRQ